MERRACLSALKVPARYDVHRIIDEEFHRARGQCYLDHAGASLYSEGQVQMVLAELNGTLLGNPHSRHTPSDTATQTLEAARHRVLEHFNTTAEDYDLIFTSGATAALRLVAEHFDWKAQVTPSSEALTAASSSRGRNQEGSSKAHDDTHTHVHQHQSYSHQHHRENNDVSPGAFVYLQENHTSVLGIRGPANQADCDVFCLTSEEAMKWLSKTEHNCYTSVAARRVSMESDLGSGDSTKGNVHPECMARPEANMKRRNCLFAYSGQCNFSGSKAPLHWIRKVQEGALDGLLSTQPINKKTHNHAGNSDKAQWFVLLDAASLAATCPLDLAQWKPDFVPISFYKLFGYPTGLGCLLVHRRAWNVLQRSYQGGGTVLMADSRTMATVPRPTLHDRFEDGTLPFLSIPAVRHGLDTLNRLTGGMHNIAAHVFHLARYTNHTLASMRHANATPVAILYRSHGDTWHLDTHGSIVSFNLCNPDGSLVGYAQVERVSSLYNIHLRTGCHCNPGACQSLLGITSQKLLSQFQAGHVCGDAIDLVDGEPTGAVRVSFGYSSTYDDADRLLTMIRECFVQEPMSLDPTWLRQDDMMGCHKDTAGKGGEEEEEGLQRKIDMTQMKELINQMTETEQLLGEEERVKRILGKEEETEKKTDVAKEKGKEQEDITSNNNSDTNNIERGSIAGMPTNITTSPSPPITTTTTTTTTYQHPLPTSHTLTLTDVVVYPVKSCGGVRVNVWELGGAGLRLDRCWMVVSTAGATLTQKRLPRMALILPRLDLTHREMVLTCEGIAEELHISLEPPGAKDTSGASLCGGRVCGVRLQGLDSGSAAGAWLSRVLGVPDLRLMRHTTHRASKLPKGATGSSGESLSLANESQYLVIHRPSVRQLLQDINSRGLEHLTEDELVSRFRANLVVDGGEPYEEDSWATLTIGSTTFQVQGGCRRCQMVCVVPGSGQRTREPMLSLASARGTSMLFGVHASAPHADEGRLMKIGSSVLVTKK